MDIFRILSYLKHGLIFALTCIKIFSARHFTKSKKVIFIMCTPRHSNLGDHAIVYSQCKLFEDLGYKKNIIEISCTTYEFFSTKIQKISKPSDLVIIDGGGNIGTLWIGAENDMRDIITKFHNNPIIIMPQTAYFEDTENGKAELDKSIEIYNAHPDLTIFCRDSDTYKLISDKFVNVKSFYTPDMVMFITDYRSESSRNGALLCFRDDPEKCCSDETKHILTNHLNKRGFTVSETSTLAPDQVEMWKRKQTLYKKWSEFSSAELIVTDRLHGMIFSAITATPCLALDNVSHKVKNGYRWLEHLPYTEFCSYNENPTDKLDRIIEISKQKHIYHSDEIDKQYELLIATVKEKL